MREVVIAGYLRTAQSRARPNDPSRDCFYKLRADELLARLLPQLLKVSGVSPKEVDDFVVGSAFGVGEQWTYGGRNPIFLANLPETIPAKFVDQQCGSSMAAIHTGFLEIAGGAADIVMVGGMEHMTRVPMSLLNDREQGSVSFNPHLFEDEAYRQWEMNIATNMGLTAEKLLSMTDLTRHHLDSWGVRSHRLAAQAEAAGFFSGEIMPVQVEQADGTIMTVARDQSVRPEATLEDMAKLKPVFSENGSMTAGNSSPLNAGASAMLLVAKETAEARGIKPLAVIRGIGFAGVHPTIMGSGTVPSSLKALRMAGINAEDIDFWEINEAFCIVALYTIKKLGLDQDRVNVMGGGTAIGHALGATGIRLVGTLARILDWKQGRYGCATACCGGGQGVAVTIERNV
ncbi:MAG: acetyl-CoA C-acetyltransferase [Desulfomonile tiedjei]|uniref:Acetyl-CoA C-acetyltransferase n=1 Tax=Desulfomonile tiedjei TaxID=2358 RepID=A0A9D6V3Z9_9BACT|nr:acetyl-CoA C-acetyltransferase [Desulfomonile tiedjei]